MQLAHIRLYTANVRECFLFYRDILGLQVLHGNEDSPYAEFHTGDIHLALEPPIVSEPTKAIRSPHEFSTNDQTALIFRVNDIDARCDQLKSKGVVFIKEPYDDDLFGHRVAYLRDPAGHLIEMNKGL